MTSTAAASGDRVERTPEEWQQQLTSKQFQVARQGGTEAAFTGAYWDNKEEGMYHCVCCGAPLFSSSTKYESGTGCRVSGMVSAMVRFVPWRIAVTAW